MKLEFGNKDHIEMAQKGARLSRLLEKNRDESKKADEHVCDCEYCEVEKYYCPECGENSFVEIKDCEIDSKVLPGQKIKITRRFCDECEIEVHF